MKEAHRRHVAVVGTGLPGLVCCHDLVRRGFKVTVFEARERPAVLAHSPTFVRGGVRETYDTLLIWPRYHRALSSLLGELRLDLVDRPFGQVAFRREAEARPYARYDAFRLPGLATELVVPRADGLRATLRLANAWLRELRWMRTEGERLGVEVSVADRYGASPDADFWENIFPWMCGSLGFPRADLVLQAPLRAVVDFQAATLGEPPRMVRAGLGEMVERLTVGAEVHHGWSVRRVESSGPSPRIFADGPDGSTTSGTFDDVVLAVPPDVIRTIAPELAGDWPSFGHDRIPLRAHLDPTLMPPNRRDWRSVVYTVPRDTRRGVATTIWWNRVAPVPGSQPLFFSWNEAREPAPETLLYSSELVRVLPSAGRHRFLADDLPRRQGARRVWYAGVWTRPGRGGYLEDGVVQARELARRIAAPSHAEPAT